MISVTKQAAAQIKRAMEDTNAEGSFLRLAARRLENGSLDYAMGFDETDHNDSHSRSNGIEIVVAPTSTELLRNATLDYVEMEGEYRYIFMNPNDPGHSLPQEQAAPETPDKDADSEKPDTAIAGFKPA